MIRKGKNMSNCHVYVYVYVYVLQI